VSAATELPTSPYDSQPSPEATTPAVTRFKDEHRFLSNFWFVPGGVHYGGMTGPTVEHVFQAAKTLDPVARREVLAAPTPLAAKQLGSKVELRSDWEQVKIGVMAALQGSKYLDPQLAAQLVGTGNALLVEGNHWHDMFWGVCSCRVHDRLGTNWSGRILMIKRSLLRA
jgi:ribA/ribD-fused uncharacterized protein